MPRRPDPNREPTTVEHLLAALRGFAEARDALAKIDLRTVRGDLRDVIRDSRTAAKESVETMGWAIPEATSQTRPRPLTRQGAA